MIELSNLSKSYGEKNVLKNVDLQLDDPTKVYALMGASGSGKSTLFNILFGLDKDFQGSFKLLGRDTQSLKNKDWDNLRSTEIGMVFQDYKLLEDLTVYENLYIAGNYSEKKIDEILNEMDLSNLKNNYVKNISGGQKQRTALARGILGEPKILLLDEPTGNLDGMTTQKIMKYIEKLRDKGILVFIITHDESILNYVDVVYTLDHCQIKSDSIAESKKQIIEENKVISAKTSKNEKHITTYTFLNILRNKKRLTLLGIPIIIILILFMLSFTAFQSYSLDSFNNFFAGLDNKTIAFNTQQLNSETEEQLNAKNIQAQHDGKRIGFSNKDIEMIKDIDHVDTVELAMSGVESLYDNKGNRYEQNIEKGSFPDFLQKDLNQLKEGETINFSLVAQGVPYSVIENYNNNQLNLIHGDFPIDNSNQILIPDLYAYHIVNNESISDLVASKLTLAVTTSDDEFNVDKDYLVSGIYATNYQLSISESYPLYLGYFPQNNKESYLTEESYQFISQSNQINDATRKYSSGIIQDFSHFKDAVGTGYDQMIVVADSEENFQEVYQAVKEKFPKYEFTSQYDLKSGDLSDIYQSLVSTLIIGSSLIAIVIGFIIVFLNKGYIHSRQKELAILFSQGYSKKDIAKILLLENSTLFILYFVAAYTLSYIFNIILFGQTRFAYLFSNLLTMRTFFSLLLLVIIIVSISILWGLIGLSNKNLIKLLKD